MSSHSHDHAAVAPAEVLDPVCGMTISPDDAVGHVDHKGSTYYFCSQSCLDQFRATPDAFLGERPAAAATPADMEREYTCPMDPEVRQKGPGACPKCGMALEPVDVAPVTKVEWTCPMHPEIVRDAPGACPICGMALEPRTVTLEESNPELDDMTRRFRWSLGSPRRFSRSWSRSSCRVSRCRRLLPHGWLNWILLALATPVVLWGGWPFFVRGWASVVNRHLNMFTLIALGVGAAYAYSVVATIAPGLFPDSFRMNGRGRGLLRAGGGHRRARAARTGAGTARPQPHQRRDPQSAGPRAENGPQDRGGRHGAGRSPRACGRR